MPRTITYSETLVVVSCWCGMHHAIPQDLDAYQQRMHANGDKVPGIYCPLGHVHVPAGKGAAQVERERAERLERTLANREEDLRAARAGQTALKGQLTKAKRRAARGVCPCCNRSFVDVARHVATKHPETLAE